MHVVLGVTGGIAAYKATNIIRLLTEAGHTVKVVPTKNALRFIGAASLEALSHNSVDPDLYTDVAEVKHVALAQEADLVIVAPATAAFLARYAAGLADDLLGNLLLATKAPVVLAPAMHTEMWQHPATVKNVEILESRGVNILAPATGRLTGADSGPGRLPEAEEILEFALSTVRPQDLKGKHFTVTAGGTRENIDPVRFIGNHSSGKQGLAIASALASRGATVTLIAANISLDTTALGATALGTAAFGNVVNRDIKLDEAVRVLKVETASELESAVIEQLESTDCLVMAAAVADFRVAEPATTKIKKADAGETLTLNLVANPDILAMAVKKIRSDSKKTLTVGFAAETAGSQAELEKLANKKLLHKGCNIIVANDVSNGAVFNSETNTVVILTDKGTAFAASGSKQTVANELVDVISDMLG